MNFGKKALKNAAKALDGLELEYKRNDSGIVLSAMGDDLPIGMAIVRDDENLTLNIYCFLMFDVPDDARKKLIPELNTINNTINNGGFYMADDENKIYFKIVQSYYDAVPSVKMLKHLILIAFSTVDMNDGNLKGLIPREAIRKDWMYS